MNITKDRRKSFLSAVSVVHVPVHDEEFFFARCSRCRYSAPIAIVLNKQMPMARLRKA
jgi:hypothetical protein